MIDPSGEGDYTTVYEALILVSQQFRDEYTGRELQVWLAAGEHSLAGGLVPDANLPLSRLQISAASNGVLITSDASTLLEVHAGAPPLKLQGLDLGGQVRIYGGDDVELLNCSFRGANVAQGRRLEATRVRATGTRALALTLALALALALALTLTLTPTLTLTLVGATGTRALLISGGHVVLDAALFEDHAAGAIAVSGGRLELRSSVLRRNEAERGGALLVTGGDVLVDNSYFAHNKATDGSESGGAIYVEDARRLVLGNRTKILGSKGYGGSVASNIEWTFVLPAPLAHYVQAQGGVAVNSLRVYDYDYPIPCSATLYGDSSRYPRQGKPHTGWGVRVMGSL